MNRFGLVAILTTTMCCEIAGADPVNKGPPTTAQYLRWLAEVQSPIDARHNLRRRVPEVKFDRVGFSDCVDFLRGLISNLIFDTTAVSDTGVKQSTPITFRRLDTPAADLLQLLLDQADPVQHRLHYAVQDEFVLISTTEGVRRLDDFERKYRPPSHDFHNVLNRRILTEGDPSISLGDTFGFPYDSMQFNDADVNTAVEAASKRANVPINVDWKGIEAARLRPGSKISLQFANLTTFDALTLILEQVYDLDRIRISCDSKAIYVNLATEPSTQRADEPVPINLHKNH
jgi:hypothetical protein